MPHPIWQGHISFGLVYIPVSLHSADKQNNLKFHLLDKRNHSRIRYERINETTGKEVPWDQIVKAYEYEKGRYVVLEEDDFKKIAVERSQTIEIEHFVNASDIDLTYFEKPYYLIPSSKGEKGYVLLREILKQTQKIGIAKVVIRSRQYLAALLPNEDALVLNLIRFPQELRNPEEFDFPSLSAHKITSKELQIAEQLVKAMTIKWNPKDYHDDYREALIQFIKEKERGLPHPQKRLPKRSTKVVDFMDLMKKSIEKKAPSKKPVVKKKKLSKAA